MIIGLGKSYQTLARQGLEKVRESKAPVHQDVQLANDYLDAVARKRPEAEVLGQVSALRWISRTPQLSQGAARDCLKLALEVAGRGTLGLTPVAALAQAGQLLMERTSLPIDRELVGVKVAEQIGMYDLAEGQQAVARVTARIGEELADPKISSPYRLTTEPLLTAALKVLNDPATEHMDRTQALGALGVEFNSVSHLGLPTYLTVNEKLIGAMDPGHAIPRLNIATDPEYLSADQHTANLRALLKEENRILQAAARDQLGQRG